MKRLMTLILAIALLLSACGSPTTEISSPNSDEQAAGTALPETNSNDASTEEIDNESSEESIPSIEVDKNLLTVDFTLSADMMGDMSEFDPEQSMADEPRIKDIVVNDDGSVTYTVTKDLFNEMVDAMKANMKDTVEGLVGGEDTPYITQIDYTDNFDKYEIYVDRNAYEDAWDFTVFTLGFLAMYSQMLIGEDIDATLIVYDNATNDVISETKYPEAFEETEEN